jgi:hypothetical protein
MSGGPRVGVACARARRVAVGAVLAGLLSGPGLAAVSPAARADTLLGSADTTRPVPVDDSPAPPTGHRLSAHDALGIAARLATMRALTRRYPGAFADAYLKGIRRWQVSYFTRGGKREIGQVLIADRDGRVLEQWTGPQVAWTMARGYPGAFGEHVNALYLWIPLSLLFVLPFVRWRRPLSLRNLDLLALISFSFSLACFNHGDVAASVPLSYPPLVYLLVRLLHVMRLGRRRAPPPPSRPTPPLTVPVRWVVLGLVALIAFRIALNVSDANVIDVGYAGVIGADRMLHARPLYGHWPADNAHGDTYGPVAYEAYVPFVALLGWSGRWDDLPAAHLAAVVFDLLAIGLCFLIGRRVRGPTLGLALAYAWAAYPFTLYALESDTNDALVAVLVLSALLVGGAAARGSLAALAGLAKFAPFALVPLLVGDRLRARSRSRRRRALAAFGAGLALAGALALTPALVHDSLHTIYQRTLAYQAHRGSPFSLWGLHGGLHLAQTAVQVAAVLLALAVAVLPRRLDLAGTAAGAAAVLIAVQLGLDHWFYLYIPWFFAPAMLALLVGAPASPPTTRAAASVPARSSRLVAA